MGQAAKAVEPEETEGDKEWLAGHPKTRVVLLVGKMLLVPMLVGAMGTWIEVRSRDNKERDEALYGTVTPAVKDLQRQVKQLSDQVDLMRKLVLQTTPVLPPSSPPPPPPTHLRPLPRSRITSTDMLEEMERRAEQQKRLETVQKTEADMARRQGELIERLRKAAPPTPMQKPLPDNLDDVLKEAK